jgi:GH43 family beta-xylosidase
MAGPQRWRSARRWARGVLAVGLLATACAGSIDPVADARPGQRPQTGGPVDPSAPGGSPAGVDAGEGLLIGTPIYDGDFADPFVLVDSGRYYAYATNTTSAHVPVISSTDGMSGTYHGDALPSVPSWSTTGFVWAPAVRAHEGSYVLYYTTLETSSKKMCVSAATASSPLGPFTDDSTAPLVCQTDLGGTIDPSIVTDQDGHDHLLFKNDGNSGNVTTSLWIAPLSDDGRSLTGDAVKLLSADRPWEANLIEGPSMVVDGSTYYLFYSANAWNTESYAVGYAVCTSITGPCAKPADDGPWMSSTTFAKGPGGQEFFGALGQVWMVYHGWLPDQVGTPGGVRRLYLDSVRIEDGAPVRVGRQQATIVLVGAVTLVVALLAGAVALGRRHRRRAAARAAG